MKNKNSFIMINRRLNNGGWLEHKTPNKDKLYCDICHKQLWVAPDGKTIYCNTNNCGNDYKYSISSYNEMVENEKIIKKLIK